MSDTDDPVGDFLRQIKLMQGHNHGHPLFPRHRLQDLQHLQLMADIEKGGRLVKDHDLRLLTDRPRKQQALPLAVADLTEGAFGIILRVNHVDRLVDLPAVLGGEQPEPSGIRVAPGGRHIPTGHKLRPQPLGHHDGELLRKLLLAHPGKRTAVDHDGSRKQPKLPDHAL